MNLRVMCGSNFARKSVPWARIRKRKDWSKFNLMKIIMRASSYGPRDFLGGYFREEFVEACEKKPGNF